MKIEKLYSYKGECLAIFFLVSLINLSIGLPFILACSVLILGVSKIEKENVVILALLIFKIFWIFGVNSVYKSMSMFDICKTVAPDIIMIVLLFVKREESIIVSFLKVCVILFYIDFAFNLMGFITGKDLLGRSGTLRTGDLTYRLGGVFNHPFYSVNISISAMVIALYLRKNLLLGLSFIALLINGTQRAPLTVVLSLVVMFILFKKVRIKYSYIIYVLFSACVFVVIYGVSLYATYMHANVMRVAAWKNVIPKIIEHPFIGYHQFLKGPFVINMDNIINYGVAESYYLQLAVDFGLLPAIISLGILSLISYRWILQYYQQPQAANNYARCFFSCMIFVDTFYGSLFGNVYMTFLYAFICLPLPYAIKSNKSQYAIVAA